MLPLADGVGFLQPTRHIGVQFVVGLNSQVMRVASRIEGLDLFKPGIVDLARQDEVTDQIRFARRGAGETHAHLKDDPRLLRNHARAATGAYQSRKLAKNLPDSRFAAGKQVFQRKFAARVPHVPPGETLAALRTLPEWFGPESHERHDCR